MRLPLIVTHAKCNHITKPLLLLSYQVPFVQEVLPELDRLYASERQPTAAAGGSRRLCPAGGSAPLEAGGFAPPDQNAAALSDEQVARFRQTYNTQYKEVLKQLTQEFIEKHVVQLHHGEINLPDKIYAPAFMRDGTQKLFWFHGGTDCRKEPQSTQAVIGWLRPCPRST